MRSKFKIHLTIQIRLIIIFWHSLALYGYGDVENEYTNDAILRILDSLVFRIFEFALINLILGRLLFCPPLWIFTGFYNFFL